MNKTLTIEDHVLETVSEIRAKQGLTMDDCDFIIAKDCNDWNAASFFIRHSEWSIRFLEKWVSLRHNDTIRNFHAFKEQAVLAHVLDNMKDFVGNHVTQVPQELINSYPFPCAPNYRRINLEPAIYKQGEGEIDG